MADAPSDDGHCCAGSPPFAADSAAGDNVWGVKVELDMGGLRAPRRTQRACAIHHAGMPAVGAAGKRRCPGGTGILRSANAGILQIRCEDIDPPKETLRGVAS